MMNTPKILSHRTKKKNGFTLIEVIAVLVLLGILAAVALPQYVDIANDARNRAIDAAVAELNGREALAWSKAVISESYADDATLFGGMNTALGPNFSWSVVPSTAGGTLDFDSTTVALSRTVSTASSPGNWSR